jgi:hypothetical protein
VNDADELTRTNIHALNEIRKQDLIVQASKVYATDRAASGTIVIKFCKMEITYVEMAYLCATAVVCPVRQVLD